MYFMSGPGEGKRKIGTATVYIHEKGKSRATVTHIDIELPALNKIIAAGENTYCGGKKGGVFLGLKGPMITRAEKIIGKKSIVKKIVKRLVEKTKKRDRKA